MNKIFLTASLALSVVALSGCSKKGPETNPSSTASASKSCSMKNEGATASAHCAPKSGEVALASADAGAAADAGKAHCAAQKAEGKSCSKKDGEMAATAHAGCTHAAGEACDHEAGAKAGRACCKAHMAAAATSSEPAAAETK